MACRSDPPSPMLVRVSHSGPRLHRKLELYFQSRSSGGGECTVRPHDQGGPDTFLVRFQARADKERVLKKENHNITLDDKIVTIYLDPTENPTEMNTQLRNSSLTQVREEQRSDEKHLNEEYIPDTVASCVQKIFLDVTADLNCDLFSKEQRNHISTLCPNIKKMEGSKGIEKVCGDFRDIEKIYHYLSKQLLDNELKCGSSTLLEESQLLHPPSWNNSVSLLERQLHYPSSSNNNVSLLHEKQLLTPSELQNRSEEKNMHCEIPLLFFEYFKYVSPNKLESIERKFGIKIKIQECSPYVHLDFIKNQSNNCNLALNSFASEFQKVTVALKEEHIILPDNEKPHKIKQKLVHLFEKLLIKENKKGLTLIGTQDDITAAKQFLASSTPESLTKVSLKIQPPEYMMNGIGVDTPQLKLLRTELCQKISEIEKTYDCQSRVSEGNQKTYIIFEPKNKELDLSVHAYVNFIDAYQDISSQLTKEILLLKSLGKKKKHLQGKKFSDDFRKNHPNVHFVSNQETMTLIGLPSLLEKAKQYVLQEEGMSLLTREKWSGDPQTTVDVDSNNSKIAPPTFQHSASAGNTGMDENKNQCMICLDTIRNKKVLSECKHEFCNDCINKAMKYKPFCPLCMTPYGILTGNQPEGTMDVSFSESSISGYEQHGTIIITYKMKGGIQTLWIS
ncbi:E3 ubiquitin-protein ligase DTX3L isoform X2 [Suncus etruscus]|uniref:E3 ubiquitin-protein ligase DTX3L isoform X2 n=1 Tax=Suncus etruscus TaxID=109475 RepID=UPI002110B38B|nr:E3 ubiquitin-protein ligase DTX3L isoform X2 [Suncus etruscus]